MAQTVRQENTLLGVALKEWGVVLDALLEGATVMILRKGGIVEPDRDGFRVLHHSFWVYPTVVHQRDEDLAPALKHLAAAARQRYARVDQVVPFAAVADVAGVWRLDREDQLAAVAGFSPLGEQALASRFHFGKAPGRWAVALRVSETAEKHDHPHLSIFGGCTSWVDLPTPLATGAATPVLSDIAFDRRLAGIAAAMQAVGAVGVPVQG